MNRVEGKVAVITGGASGIGRAAALLLAAEGAAVVVGDLDADSAATVATEITDAGGRAAGVGVDVTDEASLTELVGTACTRFGRLDVMCNHVGGSDPKVDLDVVTMDLAEFDRTVALNLRSTVLGCRLAIPHLIEAGGGSIINTASVGGLSGDYVQTGYGTSKAAVIRLSEYVATQYGYARVRSNVVAPGAVMTPSLRDNLPAELIEQIRTHNALPFIGEPDDIANVMLFLASDESRYLTGQCLAVDGGLTSHSAIAETRRPSQPAGHLDAGAVRDRL